MLLKMLASEADFVCQHNTRNHARTGPETLRAQPLLECNVIEIVETLAPVLTFRIRELIWRGAFHTDRFNFDKADLGHRRRGGRQLEHVNDRL